MLPGGGPITWRSCATIETPPQPAGSDDTGEKPGLYDGSTSTTSPNTGEPVDGFGISKCSESLSGKHAPCGSLRGHCWCGDPPPARSSGASYQICVPGRT